MLRAEQCLFFHSWTNVIRGADILASSCVKPLFFRVFSMTSLKPVRSLPWLVSFLLSPDLQENASFLGRLLDSVAFGGATCMCFPGVELKRDMGPPRSHDPLLLLFRDAEVVDIQLLFCCLC